MKDTFKNFHELIPILISFKELSKYRLIKFIPVYLCVFCVFVSYCTVVVLL